MASAERTQASQTRGMVIPNKNSKNCSERFTTYMANAGDKVWRNILKALQVMVDDDDCLDDVNDVKQVLKQVGVGQHLVEELQDALYDQLTQYTKGELLVDIQIAGLRKSQESFRSGQEEDCGECPQGAESC